MGGIFKKGYGHFLFLVGIGLVIIAFIVFARSYIYLSYQHIGAFLGVNLNNIASSTYVEWIKSQPDDYEGDLSAVFLNKKVDFVDIALKNPRVLGESAGGGERWIEVDLSDQRLFMKEGANTVGNFLVSTGKWSPTPKGEWRVWTKLRYARMRGGSKALGTWYDLPNVPYTMYYNQGYGIHGAYWHNNFGHPMSHGCVNMKPEEAGVVFNWASVGTRVVVHE